MTVSFATDIGRMFQRPTKGLLNGMRMAEESEFILDGKSVGTMYRPAEREKTGLYAMLAHWGMVTTR